MNDFIKYIVNELKAKRLDKKDATKLVRQFARRDQVSISSDKLHPLLHENISDLQRQAYQSCFTGCEGFLQDHQVCLSERPKEPVLPGVAYLEMAREAFEKSLPLTDSRMVVELRNVAWVQPLTVHGSTQVVTTLGVAGNETIDFSIASNNGEDVSTVHCEGSLRYLEANQIEDLNLKDLESDMKLASLQSERIYQQYARMGLHYGPTFRGIEKILCGEDQLLADLRLPDSAVNQADDFVLDPGVLDSALQATIGLAGDLTSLEERPALPYALESLRILSPMPQHAKAWARKIEVGSDENLLKSDIDICDFRGNVCVQIRGFCARIPRQKISLADHTEEAIDRIMAVPKWELITSSTDVSEDFSSLGDHFVLLCGFSRLDSSEIEALTPGCHCIDLDLVTGLNLSVDSADRYRAYAQACFDFVKPIIQAKPRNQVLVQLCIADTDDFYGLVGLSGLLKTAALENPNFIGQLILVEPSANAKLLSQQLLPHEDSSLPVVKRYRDGDCHVRTWEEVSIADTKIPCVFHNDGVYLVTGGLGSLGQIFTQEILDCTHNGRVIVTGRESHSDDIRSLMQSFSDPDRVQYSRLDIAEKTQVSELIVDIKNDYGKLNGVLHCAGMISDQLITMKSTEDFVNVLSPKVVGTVNIDQACAHANLKLDFMAFFSSVASVFGNVGQADYTCANGFMDAYASYRNGLVKQGLRFGQTLSINWPLWESGGMTLTSDASKQLLEETGMRAMATPSGLDAFYRSFNCGSSQVLTLEGDAQKLRQTLQASTAYAAVQGVEIDHTTQEVIDESDLKEKTQDFIKAELSETLKLPAHKINSNALLEKYGIDSILALKLTNKLEHSFGALSKTLFFEHRSIGDLANYFVRHHAATLHRLFSSNVQKKEESSSMVEKTVPLPTRHTASRKPKQRFSGNVKTKPASNLPDRQDSQRESIAIVGLSGRYPESIDMQAYWTNLRDGVDCIIEIPAERWDWRDYYSEDRSEQGRHYSKWGGFIEGVDEFDPLFFNISPREAKYIDPQERLFLQHSWMALEDAGYTRESIQVAQNEPDGLAGEVGVYVGVMYGEYQLFGAQASQQGNRMGFSGNLASIANRVSYALNLHGPSMMLDTMCSSSLTAIHLACQDLKQGRTSLAIAGGVNVSVHPNKYLLLSTGQFISSDGQCQSFGKGGDGYVPGEGVGAVVLKRLSEAERDGDQIYGVIAGSGISHGGKTNGTTVPNPQAQSSAIRQAIVESKIDPRHISYIEAHGTGTKLGDPIEIAGLNSVFRQYTEDKQFCAIGSAKSNIGHCESAAGIAGLAKVLLQMKYEKLVPSLHSSQLNPHIDFENSPFAVNQTLRTWERPVVDGQACRRIAGVSSFGAGGSNAHLIVKEYESSPSRVATTAEHRTSMPVMIPLSARTEQQLHQKVIDLAKFIENSQGFAEEDGSTISKLSEHALNSLAYTLQVGREAMDWRLGLIVTSIQDLQEKLQSVLNDKQESTDVFRGRMSLEQDEISIISQDDDMQDAVVQWIERKKYAKLMSLWVRGLRLDWQHFYPKPYPKRMSLPTYPFAKERHWVDLDLVSSSSVQRSSHLHPLLHQNVSDLRQQKFQSTFYGDESFLKDHRVQVADQSYQATLPGAAYLEIFRVAFELSNPIEDKSVVVELCDTVWLKPLFISEEKTVDVSVEAIEDDQVSIHVSSWDGGVEQVHCRSYASLVEDERPSGLDTNSLIESMTGLRVENDELYSMFERMGLQYGATHRVVVDLRCGTNQVLAHLRIPMDAQGTHDKYQLHPSLLDGALQSCLGIKANKQPMPEQAPLPFALESVRIYTTCPKEVYAWVRTCDNSKQNDSVIKVDIDLLDFDGNVCVQMKGFSTRSLVSDIVLPEDGDRSASTEVPQSGPLPSTQQNPSTLLAIPEWRQQEKTDSSDSNDDQFTQRHALLCGLEGVEGTLWRPQSADSEDCSLVLTSDQSNSAGRYAEYATKCFEFIQNVLRKKPQSPLLCQLCVSNTDDHAMLEGLSGLLKTAALENPNFVGQLILVDANTSTRELSEILHREATAPMTSVVKYFGTERYEQEFSILSRTDINHENLFKDDGVYLITGGLGGLGQIFTKEILSRTNHARIVVTGRSELSPKIKSLVNDLSGTSGRVVYRASDLVDYEDVASLMNQIADELGQLDGIIHSAGLIADNFLLKKDQREFQSVLAPKVDGAVNLDNASDAAGFDLDFLVLFSSLSSVVGNTGQADYAAANGFMDAFSAFRNTLVARGERAGRTVSINWPLWQSGGMKIDPGRAKVLWETAGISAMDIASGLDAFYQGLNFAGSQMLVMYGDADRLCHSLKETTDIALLDVQKASSELQAATPVTQQMRTSVEAYIKGQLAKVLSMTAREIESLAPLEDYGMDSVLAMNLTTQLEKSFGRLPKTLFFEYQTVRELSEYFLHDHHEQLSSILTVQDGTNRSKGTLPTSKVIPTQKSRLHKPKAVVQSRNKGEAIAIVGLSGSYPQAADLDGFWKNLQGGVDSIVEVPTERWDWRDYYTEDRSKPGHHYGKWGGFIEGIDQFDPLFFGISPLEAEAMDPQERLFLQHAWMAVEDAGYTRSSLQMPSDDDDLDGQAGVYVGVMYSEYQLYGNAFGEESKRRGFASSQASIANRVSYFLNLHGPSMTLDTMCSSSLTALHLACQDLKLGRTNMAIAGGVNLTVHPNKYLVLSSGHFISADGHCQSFGEGGDGYIPGEGVGVAILKRLSDAQHDGDHIYGVIKGSALSHGGKTNGYSVPNPKAQSSVVKRSLQEAGVDVRNVSYVEAHGTGTKLGDPIEISALSKVFRQTTTDKEFCAIGSAKSNIGHCESAAGIAGLTKVLLQMKHRQIVPSLHSARLNPHIDFANSPFFVNQKLRPWEQPVVDGKEIPRIAGVSSFGAGGANAHVIVEEYTPNSESPVSQPKRSDFEELIVPLSARTTEQLEQRAAQLLERMQTSSEELDLVALAFTLQVGREPMEERLALLARSSGELVELLEKFINGDKASDRIYLGQVKPNKEMISVFAEDPDLSNTISKWIAQADLNKLADIWVKGLAFDWNLFYSNEAPGRISLPSYPFARERYWIDPVSPDANSRSENTATKLHTLLHENVSNFERQIFSTTLTGKELFVRDHSVRLGNQVSQAVLPGVAYLEMALQALTRSMPTHPDAKVIELKNIRWTQPLTVNDTSTLNVELHLNDNDAAEYEFYSENKDQQIYCRGEAFIKDTESSSPIAIEELAQEMNAEEILAEKVYADFQSLGLDYGVSHRGIVKLECGEGQLLAKLRMPDQALDSSHDCYLPPCILDSALQSCIGLMIDSDGLPESAPLPYALDSLRFVAPCPAEMYAWVRRAHGGESTNNILKADVDLCDSQGNVCIQIRGFTARIASSMSNNVDEVVVEPTAMLVATPKWKLIDPVDQKTAVKPSFAQKHLILVGLEQHSAQEVQSGLPDFQCSELDLSLGLVADSNVAKFYSDVAIECFKRVRKIIESNPQRPELLVICFPDDGKHTLLSGLTGLLKSAMLENPNFVGQVALVDQQLSAKRFTESIVENSQSPISSMVRLTVGGTQELYWKSQEDPITPVPMCFKDDGVYLITGGLGGLGRLFAQEILAQTSRSKLILTGRSNLTAKKRSLMHELGSDPTRVEYRVLDVCDPTQTSDVLSRVKKQHGGLNGIIHSAGMIADSFILKKSPKQFTTVLEPKVTGSVCLDQAVSDSKIVLDFFMMFSSTAGALGNVGQADYSSANGFMDAYARYRSELVQQGKRTGVSISINWPLWRTSGMRTSSSNENRLFETVGMRAMSPRSGMKAFYRAFASGSCQTLVVEGDVSRLSEYLDASMRHTQNVKSAVRNRVMDDASIGPLVERTKEYLLREFSTHLKFAPHQIDAEAPLEDYGIDSILAMNLTLQMEKLFGSLSKTLFYEYQTISALARFLVSSYPEILMKLTGLDVNQVAAPIQIVKPSRSKRSRRTISKSKASYSSKPSQTCDIAIVGISGRYPMADNLEAFWENLSNGRDCVTEIPADRWDYSLYFDEKRNQTGKSYSKWGGFVSDVDKFDPLFFNISPREAEIMDPQERMFLETTWHAIEDAGYSKEDVSDQKIGVYVGVMWGQYELYGASGSTYLNSSIPSSSYASIANRISYYFNFNGPSMALDTMCSSSLTAIHLACQEIRSGGISAAIAGGVNTSIHPNKYLSLSQGNFHASDGKCKSFGAGGDGYVPGEGVGVVMLKSLDQALEDGDHVYGIIKSSAINHGGKTNGYSVPNPIAQTKLILDSVEKADLDPTTLSYLETHGTGTSLGDPIEITGLAQAFEGFTDKKQFCPIGSVKSNIGHLEAAAGIAALTKTILQMKHNKLVPSIHADPLNPHINFSDSPFYVQTTLSDWEKPTDHPRRVGISSFGAGGANGHLIVEQYEDNEVVEHNTISKQELFVLSAKDLDGLGRYLEVYQQFLAGERTPSLAEIAYTSQVGRTPFNHRLAMIATSIEDLAEKVTRCMKLYRENKLSPSDGSSAVESEVFYSHTTRSGLNIKGILSGDVGQEFLEAVSSSGDLSKIAQLWIGGATVNWKSLHAHGNRKRAILPTYPFDGERYWVDTVTVDKGGQQSHQLTANNERVPRVIDQKQCMHFVPNWIESQEFVGPRTERLSGPLLVLDSRDSLYLKISERFTDSQVIWVKLGKAYEELGPNIFIINPHVERDYQRLIEALTQKNIFPERVVHHCDSVDNVRSDSSSLTESVTNFYVPFYLSRALSSLQQNKKVMIISLYSRDDVNTAPHNAALAGFFKTLTLENPSFSSKLIEFIDRAVDEQDAIKNKASRLHQEFQYSKSGSQLIQYRDDDRQEEAVRSILEYSHKKSNEIRTQNSPLQQEGVYLISGGLGGLGFIFGEYLASNYKAKLALLGRSKLTDFHQKKIDQLEALGADVIYIQADIAQRKDVKNAVKVTKQKFSHLDGIIHAAGVNHNSLIVDKTAEEITAVMEPKLLGVENLDQATTDEQLNVFLLCSSLSGAMGNYGQSDYAYANSYLDSFAKRRANLVAKGERYGQSLSINWPYWEDGGMSLSQSILEKIESHVGIAPLRKEDGLRFLCDYLQSNVSQGVALFGLANKMLDYMQPKADDSITTREIDTELEFDAESLLTRTRAYLCQVIGDQIKLDADRIDCAERFETFGTDSVAINQINMRLESDLGEVPKTMLYEYESVNELSQFLVVEKFEPLSTLFKIEFAESEVAAPEISAVTQVDSDSRELQDRVTQEIEVPVAVDVSDEIAIIGVHSHFPGAEGLDQLWENLKSGINSISVVPSDRWDYETYYDKDPERAVDGKIYCKWGGFLEGVDNFDPAFFNISPEEAKSIDPQERLFLQSVWSSIEDAGYTVASLKQKFPKSKSADVGVFVGVTTNSYQMLAADEWVQGNRVSPGAMPWSIANRVSYFFDFQGPSMPIDSACSSSLVAIDLACKSLQSKECQVAVAGGVNLYLHPSKYLSLCQRRMLSTDGQCHSFGAQDDGFVPGEGVGSLVLKPYSQALKDNDHVYGIIKGSAYEHAGRSNGYSAPNPNSQARLIKQVLDSSSCDPETISYVEGHGTGTQLGDSIEISALRKAFADKTSKKQFCAVGSVKGNLGHAESAAGIAGIAKVLMQFKQQQIAPSINAEEINPNIDFSSTPFSLQRELSPWLSDNSTARRALVNSFGAGGVNACLVLEECQSVRPSAKVTSLEENVYLISARDHEQLRVYAKAFVSFLDNNKKINADDLAYTTQVCRTAMKLRLAIVAASTAELSERLSEWLAGSSGPGIYATDNELKAQQKNKGSSTDREAIDEGLLKRAFDDLAKYWVAGSIVDWQRLYEERDVQRISAPTYPFARQRYWISEKVANSVTTKAPRTEGFTRKDEIPAPTLGAESLHPLLTHNVPGVRDMMFFTQLEKNQFYAVDHEVNFEKIFPGAGFIEMACIAGNVAGGGRVGKIKDVVWHHPLSFSGGNKAVHTHLNSANGNSDFQIVSTDENDQKILHSEGRIFYRDDISFHNSNDEFVALDDLRALLPSSNSGDYYYEIFDRLGLTYGSSFRPIQEILVSPERALSRLKLPSHLRAGFEEFILHPALMDGALQTMIGLLQDAENAGLHLPFALDEVEIRHPLPQTCYALVEIASTETELQAGIKKFDIQLLNTRGKVLVRLKHFYLRSLDTSETRPRGNQSRRQALVS